MRDLEAFLNSLVNIDRESLIAILSSEAEAAARLANSIPGRTRAQLQRRKKAVAHCARIDDVLRFLQHNEIGSNMSEGDLAVCNALQKRLRTGRM